MTVRRLPIIFLILIIPALTCVGVDCAAQLRYGLSLGGSFASARLSGADGCGMDNRSGFKGGLMLEYELPNSGFCIDVAVDYSRYNARLTSPGTEPEDFGRNFLEIPLHAKYKVPVRFLSGVISPMILTGPDFAFRVGKGASAQFVTETFQPRWDFGVGIDIVNFIQLTGGYSLGLGNALKHFDGHPEARLHTDGWFIAANILFDF